jgi:ABC-2 type transport system permease protein
MRGARAFVVLTVYLTLMSGFTALLYVISSSTRDIYGFASGGQIGRVLFVGIVGIELFLVTFIAPAFTAGAISGERERQTYDLLRTTLLPARSLVIGKMISALSYILLLLLAAIPLQSIAFLFGGVTEQEIILSFIILSVTAMALGSMGIYFSSVMPRTLQANVMTYASALVITVGIPLLMSVILYLAMPWVTGTSFAALPFALQAGIYYLGGALIATNPLLTAIYTQRLLIDKQQAGFFTETVITNGGTYMLPSVSPWIVFTIFYVILSVVLVMMAIRRVRRIEI